jgi:hypothetical protein
MNVAVVCRLVSQLLLGGGLAFAQTSATAPALIVPDAAQTLANASVPATAARADTAAEVVYANGLLRITADNSSLNQILRSIARETGMKVTGGVRDERVFGTYGPSTPARVLASLLDGTGSNMLLRESSSNAPAELILTPRLGGATPPESTPTVAQTIAPSPAPGATRPPTPTWMTPPRQENGTAPLPAADPNLTPQEQGRQLMQQELQQQIQRQPQQHGIPH